MDSARKRVLIICPFTPPNIGGVETHLADYYDYLSEHGYSVTVLTYQPLTTKAQGLPHERRGNLTIHRYRWINGNFFPKFEKFPPIFNFLYLTPYLFLRSFLFLLRHHGEFDLIHAFGLNAAFIVRVFKTLFKKKIYVSMEALYYFNPKNFFGRVCAWVLRGFDAVLVGSEDSQQEIARLGLSPEDIIVYTHWINLRNFQPADKRVAKQQLGWEEKFTAIFIGRLVAVKGLHVFLEVAAMANADINFKIVGTGEAEVAVIAATKKLTNLEFLGKVPNREIAKYYQAADVLVYPALYDEDLSLVLLEAMACGTPVINTNPGSGVYRLNEGVAFVVKPDPAEIVKKIAILQADPKRHMCMSEAGVAFAQNFSITLAQKIADVYDR